MRGDSLPAVAARPPANRFPIIIRRIFLEPGLVEIWGVLLEQPLGELIVGRRPLGVAGFGAEKSVPHLLVAAEVYDIDIRETHSQTLWQQSLLQGAVRSAPRSLLDGMEKSV